MNNIVVLALDNPTACMMPGMETPVSTVLGWIKMIAILIAIVSLIRVASHMLRQQGDGVPDRDDTFDKLFNIMLGTFIGTGAVSIVLALFQSSMGQCA